MKIDCSKYRLVLSDDPMFEGKKLYMKGELVLNREKIDASTPDVFMVLNNLHWAEQNGDTLMIGKEVDPVKRTKLIPYIQKETLKDNLCVML